MAAVNVFCLTFNAAGKDVLLQLYHTPAVPYNSRAIKKKDCPIGLRQSVRKFSYACCSSACASCVFLPNSLFQSLPVGLNSIG